MPRTPAAARHAARPTPATPGPAARTRGTGAPAARASKAADDAALDVQDWSGLPGWRRTLHLTLALALALALLLVGLAGFAALSVLHSALRPATATDEASAVCAYLRSHDYDARAAEMDPAPASGSTGAFDRAGFAAQLRALDQREGPVRACSLRLLGAGPDGASVVFALTVRRARVADPLGSLVVVERAPNGRWTISRASTFYDSPE